MTTELNLNVEELEAIVAPRPYVLVNGEWVPAFLDRNGNLVPDPRYL